MDTQQPPVGGPSDSKETVKISPVEAAAHLYGNGFQPNDTLQKGHRVAIVAHVEGDTITAVFHNPRNEAQPLSVRTCTSQQLASWQRSNAEPMDFASQVEALQVELETLRTDLQAIQSERQRLEAANVALTRELNSERGKRANLGRQVETLKANGRAGENGLVEYKIARNLKEADLEKSRQDGWQVEYQQFLPDGALCRVYQRPKVEAVDIEQPEPEPVSLSALVPGLVKEEDAA